MKDNQRLAIRRISLVQEILRRWDPIGVRPGEEAPADEYDSYAPHLVSMVTGGSSREELCAALERIRVDMMRVPRDTVRDRQTAAEILNALLE